MYLYNPRVRKKMLAGDFVLLLENGDFPFFQIGRMHILYSFPL
ncbi:hypothetical protein ABOONEI_283 [Aciduliprofundum boonei T469]|nr:hypothetical protein ABOONEI_283 [Aciduliprofundum boonei T469]